MPDEFRRYGDTWANHHPDWEFQLWTDDNLPRLCPSSMTAWDLATHNAGRADILRHELMYQFGGVYVDTDMECLRPIDRLLEGVRAFAAWEVPGKYIGTAVLGSVPGHPGYEQALNEIGDSAQSNPYLYATGPRFLSRILVARDDVTFFPTARFYPYLATDRPPQDGAWPSTTYGVHHWAGSWADEDPELVRLRQELRVAEGRERQALRRLDAIENSRWWRLGRAIFRWDST